MAWQRDSGYNQRARVEGQFARWKQVIGDGLRFHSDEARATEAVIAAAVLNRMLDAPELRPRRMINSRGWGLLCLFLLHATRWRRVSGSIPASIGRRCSSTPAATR